LLHKDNFLRAKVFLGFSLKNPDVDRVLPLALVKKLLD
jgi:hypothetical protein